MTNQESVVRLVHPGDPRKVSLGEKDSVYVLCVPPFSVDAVFDWVDSAQKIAKYNREDISGAIVVLTDWRYENRGIVERVTYQDRARLANVGVVVYYAPLNLVMAETWEEQSNIVKAYCGGKHFSEFVQSGHDGLSLEVQANCLLRDNRRSLRSINKCALCVELL